MKKKFLAAVMALVMIGTTPVGVFADTMVKSYLTGLDVPESEGRVRPVAVMLNNIKQGCHRVGVRMPVLCMSTCRGRYHKTDGDF